MGQLVPNGQDSVPIGSAQLKIPLTVTVGGRQAQILYAGDARGIAEGVVQINVRIPADTPTGTAIPVVLSAGLQGRKVVNSLEEADIAIQ